MARRPASRLAGVTSDGSQVPVTTMTSAVTVHRLADEDAQLGEAWLTVDRRGYLHRAQAERLSGQASLEQPSRAPGAPPGRAR